MTTFRILQLTDLHVFKDAGATLKNIPTRALLADVVRHVLESGLTFDHVVVTGDHTHDELPESYAAVRELLSPWQDRLHVVPGNHDDRTLLREVFSDGVVGQRNEPVRFTFIAGDWLCIGVDTHVPGEVPGLMDTTQIEWLNNVLITTPDRPVVLFMHHPPVDVGSAWMDPIGLKGRELLQVVVQAEPRIKLICCGHVHHEFTGSLGMATVVTTPATGIQFSPAGNSPTMDAAAPGYRVIELNGCQWSSRVVRLPEIRFRPM